MKLWLKLTCIGTLLPILMFLNNCQKSEDGDGKRGVSVDTRTDTVVPDVDELGQYHALIIGINDYEKWPPLKFAYQDAEDLREILTSRYRFDAENISFLGNREATLSNIITVLTRLLSSLSEKDNLLIYYAGHGQLDPLTDSGYWIPVNGEIYDETTWIRFSTITEKIVSPNVKLKNILLITDSCYGGALSRSGPTPGKANPDLDGEIKYLSSLANIAGKPSRQVVASGGFEEVPDQSVFAELLKHNLRENTFPMIDVEYMFFKNVLPELIKVGNQRPRISKLASGLNIDGQFIFALREATLTPTDSTSSEPIATDTGTTTTTTDTDRGETYPPKLPAPAPQIVVFNATPLDIQAGQMLTLTWQTQNAVAVTLNGSTVALSGATKMLPSESTTFTLNAVNADGEMVTSDLAIQVIQPSAEITELSVSPTSIIEGQSAVINWSSKNALTVELEGIGEVNADGSQTVSPNKTTSYVLRVKGATGEIRRSVTLSVEVIKPEILVFEAMPTSISSGGKAVLSWAVKNANTVTLNGKTVSAKDRLKVAPTGTTKYELTAHAKSGDAIRQVVAVTVAGRATNITALDRSVLTAPLLLTTVLASGNARIKQTYTADLDTAGAPSNGDGDIWFEAKTATDRWVVPRGKALLGYMGATAPGINGCKKANVTAAGVNIDRLKVGDFLCVKTTQGHFSQVKVISLPAARVGVLDIQFTTWK